MAPDPPPTVRVLSHRPCPLPTNLSSRKYQPRRLSRPVGYPLFDRPGPLNLENFEGSGADWLERFKPYIEDDQTVVCSPHKVYGPQNNDLELQLRKRGIQTVLLAGMSANLCVESHMRDLLENGFEVIVIKDATAAAQSPELGDGYAAALTNFAFMANDVVTTEEVIETMTGRRPNGPTHRPRA